MLRGRRMNPEFSNTQPVEIRFHHRVDIAQLPLRLVPPATLLEADKEVDKLPQRPVKAGAPPKANIPHTGEAIVTHVAGIGDPSLQSAVFVINDNLMGARPAGRSGTWRSGTDCMAVDASTWRRASRCYRRATASCLRYSRQVNQAMTVSKIVKAVSPTEGLKLSR